MSVVPFDEPVAIRHLPADGRDRCLKGVPLYEPPHPGAPAGLGFVLHVYACRYDRGHRGKCLPERRVTDRVTRCGLPMHDRPWVPDRDAPECPDCFETSEGSNP